MFFFKNLGINSIASKVVVSKGKNDVTIEFNPGTGVVNGGHTMKAILDVKDLQVIDPHAIVRLEVIVFDNLDKDTLTAIANSKNMTSVLKAYSKANLLGYFIPLKGYLKDDYASKIVWYEGAEVSISALKGDDIIVILNLFNIEKYNDFEHPVSSVNSKQTVFNSWENECKKGFTSLSLLYPLVNDIIELYEYVKGNCTVGVGNGLPRISPVAKKECKPPKKQPFTGIAMKYDIDTAILYPILAAFRADLEKKDGVITWIEEPKQLFDKIKRKIADGICETWSQDNSVTKMSRNKLLWRDLYRTVKIDGLGTSGKN